MLGVNAVNMSNTSSMSVYVPVDLMFSLPKSKALPEPATIAFLVPTPHSRQPVLPLLPLHSPPLVGSAQGVCAALGFLLYIDPRRSERHPGAKSRRAKKLVKLLPNLEPHAKPHLDNENVVTITGVQPRSRPRVRRANFISARMSHLDRPTVVVRSVPCATEANMWTCG